MIRPAVYKRRWYRKHKRLTVARAKKWKQNNPEKRKAAWRDSQYRLKYGITLAQYETMLLKQQGVCAICKRPPKKNRLHVDHEHAKAVESKRVRGLLCYTCNRRLIGRWKKEHAFLFRLAADYLESTFDGRTIKEG